MADKGASWDDEISTAGAAEDVLASDGTMSRKPASTPKAQTQSVDEITQPRKAGFIVPRTIDAFVETEEEVGARSFMSFAIL